MDFLPLTDDDYSALSALQHDRLRAWYTTELQHAALMTRSDATLVVICSWLTLQQLGKELDVFCHFAWLATGCSVVSFYVGGEAVLSQSRNVGLDHCVNEAKDMAIAEAETAATATAPETTALQAVRPRLPLNELVQMLADEIAFRAIAKIEASPVMVNHAIRQQQAQDQANGYAPSYTPEQPPVIEAAAATAEPTIEAAPAVLPKVRLKGIYTPTRSNWVQSAKRYLKAVDPTGPATKALAAIVAQTPIGQAHLARAIREYPESDRETAQTRLYNGFLKVAAERGIAVEVAS